MVTALKAIANKPGEARQKAGTLRDLLGDYTWTACAEEAVQAFGWSLQKGSMPAIAPEDVAPTPSPRVSDAALPIPSSNSPLQIPVKRWKTGIGLAESQLLRAEEALVPFDPARQPELDSLNTWLEDTNWPQAVRLITGAGGLGKTRLAIELCNQRMTSGWHAGFLDTGLNAGELTIGWQTLQNLNQPLLIVIDYAETRQTDLLSMIKAMLQHPGNHPVRLLLLARDGGEWWDNLPSKDIDCEPLLNGYATSGPFRLPPLHVAEEDRRRAYQKALKAFANILGVTAPDFVPELAGDHFERPLYLQMAALLALYGERPLTAEGLTKALLNHERRYWRRLLTDFAWAEPERPAQLLLALTTLAGGFSTSKDAWIYWTKASGNSFSTADFTSMFHALIPLYPGKQGLQAVRPDLLGEALVAQALLRPEAANVLDAVLDKSAVQPIRRNALTVIARLSSQRLDLHETLSESLASHFSHCCQDIVSVITETNGQLPLLAETAFTRLSPAVKSQVAGLLSPMLREESVQLAELSCLVTEYLAEKGRQKQLKKSNIENRATYAGALINHSVSLSRTGRDKQTLSCALEAFKHFRDLIRINRQRFEPDYARSLNNYANSLSDAGQNEPALEHARQALDIYQRLAQRNPDRYDENLFSITCFAHFLSWLCGHCDNEVDLTSLSTVPTTIPEHRRSLLLIYAAFVQACRAANQSSRTEAFKQVTSIWSGLSLADKVQAQEYWLCAAAWCAVFAPETELDWEVNFHQYANERHGNLPHWMQEIARRLMFQWPAIK